MKGNRQAYDPAFITRRDAYHEAGHAIVSYLFGVRFVRINLDRDPHMNDNPGVEWDPTVLKAPIFQDDPLAWHAHHQRELTIDLGGRAAERFVREHEIAFPSLAPNGITLALHPEETAKNDLVQAWERYIRMETRKRGRAIWESDYPDLLRAFEEEYRLACSFVAEAKHRAKVEALADELILRRKMTYSEAYAIIEHA